jgi:hypothetical protein
MTGLCFPVQPHFILLSLHLWPLLWNSQRQRRDPGFSLNTFRLLQVLWPHQTERTEKSISLIQSSGEGTWIRISFVSNQTEELSNVHYKSRAHILWDHIS